MSPLFRLGFAFAFSHKMAHSVSEKGLCGISKSETLASQCDPEGTNRGVGEGAECGVEGAETRLRTRRAFGFSYSITIGSRGVGGMLPLNLSKKREEQA